MDKRIRIFLFLPFLLLAASCFWEDLPTRFRIPEGTPVTLTIGFGAQAPVDVQVSTKAGASRADESRVHDLYVLIFDSDGARRYGRYFSYQHRWDSTGPLTRDENENEGWYVENKTLEGIMPAISQTRGAVKIATSALTGCTLVLLANVSGTLVSLGGEEPLDALNAVDSYTALQNLPVLLNQDVVTRNDLFLMLGERTGLDMTTMTWDKTGGVATGTFGSDYQVTLSPLDAKVKFRIRANSTNIKELSPLKWSVSNVPSSCFLYEKSPYAFPSGEDHYYFDSDLLFFDGEETDAAGTWQTFTFYILESCLPSDAIPDPSLPASYYLREKQDKAAAPENSVPYVTNGAWTYAPQQAPFVRFSLSMAFDDPGIADMAGWDAQTNPQPVSVTAETSYTVHLGDFSHNGANDYNTLRGHFYTYDIVINNASNLYAEVKSFNPDDPDDPGMETQPGQEGSLLFNNGGVVNCDAHYEYRSIDFAYNPVLAELLASDPDYHVFSWNVRTPFSANGAPAWDSNLHRYVADSTEVDFLWVTFAVNKLESGTDPKQSTYSKKRIPYPGKDAYDYSWYPGKAGDAPLLMDINQLLNFIYYQYALKEAGAGNDIFDSQNMIRATAFVDEYYYERDPLSGQMNPDLWRKFVNADPREMHILSDIQSSRDRRSNIISSSHSIIQRSIQSIYNIDSPELSSIWGTEHKDEIRETEDESQNTWTGWDWGISAGTIDSYVKDEDNGRLNSVALWGLYPTPDADHDQWEDFLKYDVINSIPELKDADHRKMAYSCLTRNRDNDGDGVIDPEEIRWYMASINQLKGMWVGNESLSSSARLYQPWGTDWRAHVISSTCRSNAGTPVCLVAEEGVATFNYAINGPDWAEGGASKERLRESVRCVRNVGTYRVGNLSYDITSAPFTETPDNYYTVETNVDPDHPADATYSTYTLRFRRLDPRSLREFSDQELPFHDEKSVNNRVYLELHTQSRASRSTDTPDYADGASIFSAYNAKTGANGLDSGDINEDITNDGYDKYCPAGYRLPNQTELAMMTLALPSSFWSGGGSNSRFPSRTYFSHGFYAAPGQQTASETSKLSWVYNGADIILPTRQSPNRQISARIRCVRDSNLTGTISGKMYLANNRIMPGETTTLTFNISSTAASLASGRLYLCYNDASGNPVEVELPLDTPPSGMHYRTSQAFTAPQPAALDPAPGQLPVPMQLKLVLTNARGNSETTFYAPFTLADLSVYSEFEIQPGHDALRGFPISVYAQTTSDGTKLSALRLEWRKSGGEWAVLHDLSAAATGKSEYEQVVYFNPSPLETTSYFFRVVSESGSHTHTTPRKSMEILQKDRCWNAEDLGNPWQSSADVDGVWEAQQITGLDFAAGDFIETKMDISACVFTEAQNPPTEYPYQGPYKKYNNEAEWRRDYDIGMDNLFSIGLGEIGNVNSKPSSAGHPWVYHVYYPSHSGSKDYLYPSFVYLNNGWNGISLSELDRSQPLLLRIDRQGMYWNGLSLDMSKFNNNSRTVLSRLTSASTLYIGATEGFHHSRAVYDYVRVVRNDLEAFPEEVNGSLGDGPQNGGRL